MKDMLMNGKGRLVKLIGYRQLRNGKTMYLKDIRKYERQKLSDRQIAKIYDISPMGFYYIRNNMAWLRRHKRVNRSDKGIRRVNPELSRQKKNAYMREYHKRRMEKNSKV